jgi:hypothetical protein
MASIVLFTNKECPPCKDVEDKFKAKYASEIESGDAEVFNTDENEAAAAFATQNGLGAGTHIIIVSDDGSKLLAKLDIDKELPSSGPNLQPAVVTVEGESHA